MTCCFCYVVAAALVMGNDPSGLQVKVMSFNIRYGTAPDGDNAWQKRADLVVDVIRDSGVDFCGLQEALRFQIDAIREAVPAYAEHGRGRDDGQTGGEYSAILYRRDRWKLAEGDTLWLSDTPRVPGSASWGNRIPRIVTWGRFVERNSGQSVYVFNTHFDHRSQPSRLRSARFLKALVAEQAGHKPVIVTGDFNAGERNPAIEHLTSPSPGPDIRLVDSFRVLHPSATEVGTFNKFRGATGGEKIDYVFTDPSARVVRAEIVRTSRDGQYPSDHFPVTAELVFPAK